MLSRQSGLCSASFRKVACVQLRYLPVPSSPRARSKLHLQEPVEHLARPFAGQRHAGGMHARRSLAPDDLQKGRAIAVKLGGTDARDLGHLVHRLRPGFGHFDQRAVGEDT